MASRSRPPRPPWTVTYRLERATAVEDAEASAMDEVVTQARAQGLEWTHTNAPTERSVGTGAVRFSSAPDSPELHVACRTLERLACAVPGVELRVTDSMNALHVAKGEHKVAVYMARRARSSTEFIQDVKVFLFGLKGTLRLVDVQREPTWPVRLGWPCLAVRTSRERERWQFCVWVWSAVPGARLTISNLRVVLHDVRGVEIVPSLDEYQTRPVDTREYLFLELGVEAEQAARATALAVHADLKVDVSAPVHSTTLRAPPDLRDDWHGWNVGGRRRGYTAGTESKVRVQWRRHADPGYAEVRVLVTLTHRFAGIWPDGEIQVRLAPEGPVLAAAFVSGVGSQEHTIITRLAVEVARSIHDVEIDLVSATTTAASPLLLVTLGRLVIPHRESQ